MNFIQSNWHRKYPFRAGQVDGDNPLPTDLIVALRITCDSNNTNVFISNITTSNNIVSVSFNADTGPIGFANGIINTSNQSLVIKNFKGGVIGNVTIGNIDNTVNNQTFTFDNTNGLVEASTILVLSKPAVSSIVVKLQNVVGAVTLTSKTLNISTSSIINLSVNYPESITSRGDLCAETLTCGNAIISGINTVTPDENNNIDIYAIAPLKIETATIEGIRQLQLSTPELSYQNLCNPINLPPADPVQVSHTPIATIINPEWTAW